MKWENWKTNILLHGCRYLNLSVRWAMWAAQDLLRLCRRLTSPSLTGSLYTDSLIRSSSGLKLLSFSRCTWSNSMTHNQRLVIYSTQSLHLISMDQKEDFLWILNTLSLSIRVRTIVSSTELTGSDSFSTSSASSALRTRVFNCSRKASQASNSDWKQTKTHSEWRSETSVPETFLKSSSYKYLQCFLLPEKAVLERGEVAFEGQEVRAHGGGGGGVHLALQLLG